jgi:hypothetical protein
LEPIVSRCSFNKQAAHKKATLNPRPFCLLANTDYVPTPNEMRLRLELTRYQPNAPASIAPLSVANACDSGEPLLDRACRSAI